jgi:hypothetical protein
MHVERRPPGVSSLLLTLRGEAELESESCTEGLRRQNVALGVLASRDTANAKPSRGDCLGLWDGSRCRAFIHSHSPSQTGWRTICLDPSTSKHWTPFYQGDQGHVNDRRISSRSHVNNFVDQGISSPPLPPTGDWTQGLALVLGEHATTWATPSPILFSFLWVIFLKQGLPTFSAQLASNSANLLPHSPKQLWLEVWAAMPSQDSSF